MEEVSDCCPASANDQHLEEYIDIEVSSTTFFCYTISSPPDTREFEFHMSSNPAEREPIPSPADELFYEGKLLPLHLPPRLQMVQKILQNPVATTASHERTTDPLDVNTTIGASITSSTTPSEACNISPAGSRCTSTEMNPGGCYGCAALLSRALPKKPWCKKRKLKRESSLALKLKASREYLRFLFTRSVCSEGSCAARKAEECSSMGAGRRSPFGKIGIEDHGVTETNNSSSTSSSSSCSSCSCSSSGENSVGHGESPMLRSSSVGSEAERSIQGAIAYCKKSQRLGCARSFGGDGCLTLSSSSIDAACEDIQKLVMSPGLCPGHSQLQKLQEDTY